MSLLKKNEGGYFSFKPFVSDFFKNERISLSKMFNGEDLPAVNISENEKSYEIEVAAPGMKKDDFKVKVENGMLVITGEKKEDKEEIKKNYTRQEHYYNTFSRSFSLPDNASEDDVKATYDSGMLRIWIAKREGVAAKSKEIAVG